MRYLKFVVFSVAIAAMALLVSSENAFAADDVEFDYPESLYGMQEGDIVSITLTISDTQASWINFTVLFGTQSISQPTPVENGVSSFTRDHIVGSSDLAACIEGGGTILVFGDIRDHQTQYPYGGINKHIPCSVLTVPNLNAIQQYPICGADNDEITGLDMQPTGVVVDAGSWVNGSRIVTLSAATAYSLNVESPYQIPFTDSGPCLVEPVAPLQTEICGSDNDELAFQAQPSHVIPGPDDSGWFDSSRTIIYSPEDGYAFPQGPVMEFTFTDSGPCLVEPVEPLQSEICGTDNDELALQTQPPGVNPDPADTDWIDGSRTITYSPADGYTFADGQSVEFTFTDSSSCVAEPIAPIQSAICGMGNDELALQTQPTGVNPDLVDSGWVDGSRTITYTPADGYTFADGQSGEFTFTDSGSCETEPPIPPIVTEVCGPNNDEVALDTDQPANVLVDSDGAWEEGEWTITFTATEGYALPSDIPATYDLVDSSTPCPTDAPISPVQSAVCGPDNDEISIPDQPEGVTLQSDSGWTENERVIHFAVLDGYATDGATSFTFTDTNEPCPETPIGKTVTVNLMTSDGGSLEGASYALFAPIASQTAPTAFEEGVVGSNNQLVFENVISGQYRLTITASGYEPLDEIFTVSEGSAPEQFEFQMVAMQEAPAPTAVAVHGLPNTGTGATDGTTPMVVLLVLAVMIFAVPWTQRITGKHETGRK